MTLVLSPEQLADRSSHSALASATETGTHGRQAQAEMNGIQQRIADSIRRRSWLGSKVCSLRPVAGSVRPLVLLPWFRPSDRLRQCREPLSHEPAHGRRDCPRAALRRPCVAAPILTESGPRRRRTRHRVRRAGPKCTHRHASGKLPRAEGTPLTCPCWFHPDRFSGNGHCVRLPSGLRFASADTLKKVDAAQRASTKPKFRSALVVTEMALSLVQLVGAGLMIRSLASVAGKSGFNPNILTTSISLYRGSIRTISIERRSFSADRKPMRFQECRASLPQHDAMEQQPGRVGNR